MSTVIVGGARTPIGKLSGGLSTLSSTELGGVAIAGALTDAGIEPGDVDYVVMGQVLLGGAGQAPARKAAALAGLPLSVPAATIDKVCLSGINAIHLAHQMVSSGEADIVVAGGMESMSQAPYLLPGARNGYRAGDQSVIDSLFHDGLFCALDACLMGEATDRYSSTAQISRAAQDEVAAASHERAAAATKNGTLAEEIVSVPVPQRRGEPLLVSDDEGIRADTTVESLGGLRPAFDASGNITAGNASQISDGASAVVVMRSETAAERGVEVLGTIMGYGQVAGPDPSLLHQPANAIRAALARTDISLEQLDLFEINEAFAAVAVASMNDLGIDSGVVNVNGGAIALGHPLGASGNRLVLTLLHELRRRGGGHGAAALCGGGGQGDAIIVRV